VTVQLLKRLEIEAGAYALRIPTSYFVKYGNNSEEGAKINVGISNQELAKADEAHYSFKISINT
jgi:hypothetical protein